jgi:thioredoxin reductase (NADPH)
MYPQARKVLLTAYADTEAAITSINDIGLDHYLMKPWHPPDQRLFPVLDDLLGQWSAHARQPFEGIRVAGALWSPQSYAVREFLSRNQVPYQWIDVDQDAPMRELALAVSGDPAKLPVVFLPDGSHLVTPTNLELASKAGLQTRAKLPFYDVVVVGAGPAGLAVSVYAGSEGLQTLLIEQNAPGGQAGTSSLIENYLGFPSGLTGEDLARRATAQARRFGVEILDAQQVVSIRRHDPYRIVKLADGHEVSCYVVMLATGMAVRRLDVPGIDRLLGVGVYYGAALSEAAMYRGRDVVVVGGANSAGQGAMFFSRYARTVTMLVRAPKLRPGMSHYLAERIKNTPNIEVINGVEVAAVHGTTSLERISVKDANHGTTTDRDAAAMFIFIGTAPRSDAAASLVALDDKGFILTGAELMRDGRRPAGWVLDRDPLLFETSVPGVFAVGDVRSGANRRVATAVGEGSASILLVHKYLQTV